MIARRSVNRWALGAVAGMVVVTAACGVKVGSEVRSSTTDVPPSGPAHGKASRPWTARVRPVSEPTASDHEIFVTAQGSDSSITGVAVDASTGRVLWQQRASAPASLTTLRLEAPVPVRGKDGWVAVQLESIPGAAGVAKRSAYVGRDAETGARKWSLSVDKPVGSMACGELICLRESGFEERISILGVNPNTGTVVWRWVAPAVSSVDVLAADARHLYVSVGDASGEAATAINLADGTTSWRHAVNGYFGATPARTGAINEAQLSGNAIVLNVILNDSTVAGSRDRTGLIGLDVATGAGRWARHGAYGLSVSPRLSASGPTLNESPQLVAAAIRPLGSKGAFTLTAFTGLDPSTGATLWTRPVGFRYLGISQPPPVVGPAGSSTMWLPDPLSKALVGTDLSNGARVPALGPAWRVLTDNSGMIEVPSLGEYESPFGVQQVELPAMTPQPGGVPPETLGARASTVLAWLGPDGLLHGGRARQR